MAPSSAARAGVGSLFPVIRLDAATVLLQWSAGGLFFLWFTTRRREIGPGYGWLLRGIYLTMAAGAVAAGLAFGVVPVREAAAAGALVAGVFAFIVSVVRRGSFTPALDLIAPATALVGLVAAGVDAAGDDAGAGRVAVSLIRVLAGAAFLGAVTDAMLLGHWYLVQPGLPRRHLNELVRVLGLVWPIEVAALLLPTGMFSVWSGSVSDGWNGTLGWFWGACAVTTIALVFVTRAALRERYYSAVMAATGLLYLAILTAFGTDLVARAVLAG
jgi:hypothetical protein